MAKKNNFYSDSFRIFKKISKKIVDSELTDDDNIIENALFFAIGIEKLLKGIIYDVNPLYILESPDFKNSVPLYYGSLINDKTEITKSPNGDVIAFHSSVLRAATFSKAILDNKNTLMKLKNARDIIVHHNYKNLEIEELKILLERDFYPLLSAISAEHNLGGQNNFFSNLHSKLARKSSTLQNDVEKQIKLKMESASAHWATLKGSSTFDRKVGEARTAELLKKVFAYPAECPSCKNYGVVYTAPLMEFDSYKNEMVQTGLETKAFKCGFCTLEVADYKELDYLKIKPDTKNKDKIILEYKGDLEVLENSK
ncbi:hypothetical protein FPZ42_08930 [Mucilaginibacter achroorhodeus]|uniref:Uncharacterized protein n=1 Tax=Mucilaginibacter achroorhodeus TaxID=2599294 RepID=A0A563U727_9SPHI|nr:hypothetical protein [Mucilaginibacter achroorhodeus]TWR27145.1 hypothetical protein FPZ42_08930 [Mucilaginibacter achroorhodeus]